MTLTLLSLLLTTQISAQTTTVTDTLYGPATSTEIFSSGTPDTSDLSLCPATLSVQIPANSYVYGVDVQYSMTASGQAWKSEQASYLRCASTGHAESAVSQGVGNQAGTMSYNRSNLILANGVTTTGLLNFELHAFRTWGGSGCDTTLNKVDANSLIISVTYGAAPSCFAPTQLTEDYVTDTEAKVSWVSGGAAHFQLKYGAVGFSPSTSGTWLSASAPNATITGLTASTSYDVYVRDSCGVGNSSAWAGPITVTTLCSALSAPWLENFDGSQWSEGTGNQNNGNTIDTCWDRSTTSSGWTNYQWGTGTGTTPTGNTGPSTDHTTGSANYVYTEASGGGYQDVAEFISPLINTSGLSYPSVTFWYHMYGTYASNLAVDVWTSSGWQNNVHVLAGPIQSSSTASWDSVNVSLAGFSSPLRVRFRATRSFQATGDIAIDDVHFENGPSCPAPTGLTSMGAQFSTADLSSSGSTAGQHEFVAGTVGQAPGQMTLSTVVTGTSGTLTGLASGTAYHVYVRAICGTGDTSSWYGPVLIQTLCAPVSAPYFEDFDSTTFIAGSGTYSSGDSLDACWYRNPQRGTGPSSPYFWAVRSGTTSTPNTGPTSDASGSGKYVYTESSSGLVAQQATLQVAPVDVSSLTSPELGFSYHMAGNTMGTLGFQTWQPSSGWSAVTTVASGTQQSNAQSAWIDTTFALPAGDTLVVRFVGTRGTANRSDIAIDEVSIHEAPPCPDPSGIQIVSTTSTTATIQWTSGGATHWNIAYGPTGTVTPSSSFVAVTSNPYTITGLTPGTSYDFYVRDSCGTGVVSTWKGAVSFQTPCASLVAPFTENFDGTSWVTSANQAAGTIDPCWSRSSTSGYWWKPESGTTPSNQTGPSGDHTSGSGKYLFTETTGSTTPTEIISPVINLDTLSNPQLSFWYHMFGQHIQKMEVFISVNGGTYTSVWNKVGAQHSSSTAAWTEAIISLSSYTGDSIQVKWVGSRYSSWWNRSDMAIDDVSIDNAPACPAPTGLTVSSVTSNSATLSWTTGGATAWQIEYGPAGFTSGSGTLVGTSTNPFTITGLSANTSYDFYVRDSCGTSHSVWVGAVTGMTACGVTTAPYTEDFDSGFSEGTGNQNNGSTIDPCWSRTPNTGSGGGPWNSTYHWGGGTGTTPTNNTGPSTDHTSGSGSYVYVEASGMQGTTATLLSPWVDLDTLSNPQLEFWKHQYGSGIGTLTVSLNDGSGWTTIHTATGNQANQWAKVTVSLASYLGDTIQLRFVTTKTSGWGGGAGDVAIDDINIDNAPQCPTPSALTATATGSGSVQLAWTTGGATAWQIEYGPVGFTPGAGTLANVTTNPVTINGLSAQTAYDFYVRDSCAVGSVSAWEGPAAAMTLCSVTSAPFTETFDGSDWVVAAGGFTYGSIDTCWTRQLSSSPTYWWRPGQGGTPTNQTGPTMDHTTMGGKYAYTESWAGATSTQLTTPLIDISTLTTPELRFWYHMFGSMIDSLQVQVIHNGTATHIHSLVGQQQSSNSAAWQEAVVSLAAFAGDSIQVRFTGYRSPGNQNRADIAIDDVTIDNVPTCFPPTNVQVTATTTTTATISWTTGGATAWQIEYGPFGSVPGGGTIINVTTNPYTITGLSPSTTYAVVVRDSCAVGNTSAWSVLDTIQTACGTIQAPYYQNFDIGFNEGPNGAQFWNAGSTIDPCWSRTPNSAGTTAQYHWGGGQGGTPTGQTGPNGDHTTGSGSYVYAESSFGSPSEVALLETPLIDLSALTLPELKFWYHMRGSSIGSLRVDIYSQASGTYTAVDSIVGAQGNSWQEFTYDLSAYANQTVKVRFRAAKNTQQQSQRADMAIDDLSINEAPACPAPSNIQVAPLSQTSAMISWSGNGTGFIEYGPTGFTQGAGTVVQATGNPYTLTGLTAGTTYDIYIQDSCGVGQWSTVSGPVTFTTFNCPNGCQYVLNLTDTWGDGWAANNQGTQHHEIELTVGTTTTSYTFSSGTSATFNINVCDGDTLRLRFVNNGNWSNECGWTLSDPSGIVVNSHTAGSNITTNYYFNGSADCGSPCPPPVAVFTTTIAGLGVNVDGSTSTGTQLIYTWSYGDGTTGNINPGSHTYGSDGTYTIQLVVTDVCGQSDTATQTITVCSPTLAPFAYTTNTFTANFTATGSNYSYVAWDFGDGQSGTGMTTTHTYANGGSYNVTLTVVNLCGDTLTDTQVVEICQAPVASFTWFIVSSSGSGMLVQFDGTASTGGTYYQWYFGDGTSATGTNFTQHMYGVPSLQYKVTLTVTNACGMSDTVSHWLSENQGLDEGALSTFKLYPNPIQSGQALTLESVPSDYAQVQVTDASGRIVHHGSIQFNQDGRGSLATGDWSSGLYNIRLISGEGIRVSVVMVE